MNLGRRSFLKILVGSAAAAVAAPIIAPKTSIALPPSAPLFVPAQNLDMGVPRRILTATEMPQGQPFPLIPESVQREIIEATVSNSIPMLLLQDNFIKQYGGKLKAGTEVLVDRTTADRWVAYGVATPGPKAPTDLQLRSAQRIMERQAAQRRLPYDPRAMDRFKVPAFDRAGSSRI